MKWIAILPIALLAGCFDASNAPSCTISCTTNSDCTEGQTCNTAAGKCTAGDDCANPETCTPNAFVACVDGASRTCNATGDGTVDAACGAPGCNVDAKRCNVCVPSEVSCSADNTQVLTCAADGGSVAAMEACAAQCVAGSGNIAAHCRYLEPKWLPDICDMPAMMDTFMPNASATFSSDLDTNCTGGVVAQTAGRAICVVRYKTITIPQSVTLTISGMRPIAFVADTALTVNGTLDGSANGTTSGPGGGTQTSGTGPTTAAGGGGAGFAQAGAAGGDTGTGNGGAGGAVLDPITLAFFAGGPKAGSPGGFSLGPSGGGGGGGILLAACRGSVTLSSTSTIDVGGGGGGGQRDIVQGAQINQSECGAGGGAGGYVVVQGLTGVSMTGSIFANGGGGGGGNTANDPVSGMAGTDGPRSIGAGGNGGAGGGTGASGGDGGFRGTNPQAGGGTTAGDAGAGGGGSLGVVHVFTPAGVSPMITNTNMSPAPSLRSTPTR